VAAIHLIEDDPPIRAALQTALVGRGHVVETSVNGLDGLARIVDHPPEVIVLDLGLPDVDGADLLGMIRAVSSIPVIIATARDDELEIVRLLDAGADDYLVKPFSADQLEARLRAVLRRSGSSTNPARIVVGGIQLDVAARTATLDGAELELTRKEFDLLSYLAENLGAVVSRSDILAEVWRQPFGGNDKTIDVHVSWLRKKLGETAAKPHYLHTVRGVGMRLVDPGR
jgi:two-component system KDP operon response regulator KdpE